MDSLRQEAAARAKRAGVSPAAIEQALLAERAGRPYAIEFENHVGGSFYRVTQEGGTRVLYLNEAHPFFLNVYALPGNDARTRAGIELFLWTLGIAELEAGTAGQAAYVTERFTWSQYLALALPKLAELTGDLDTREYDEELDQ